MSKLDEQVICPLNGNTCPGPHSCGPAVMGSTQVDGKLEINCPITHVVAALSYIANRAGALIVNQDEPEERGKMDYVKVDQVIADQDEGE